MRLLDSVDPELYRGALYIVETLRARGFEALFAGGAVRDLLLGREVADIDITTSAPPEIIERIFPSTIPVGKQFGVIIVIMGSHQYEVATFRADSDYSDGRHPTRVSFTNARKDAQRRDFTVNALFYDPSTGEVLDFVGGRRDLERKIIRTVGDPRLRFEEDKLRLLRTVRFACLLGFQVEQDTLEQVHRLAQDILQVSAERIRDELLKIFCGPAPGRGLDLLSETGLLAAVLPEVEAMKGVEQPPEFHPEGDVFVHTRLMLELARNLTDTLALGILLHDVGKPSTFRIAERIRFDRHAEVGARMAASICRRLRLSRQKTEKVVSLVRRHLRFMHVRQMRESTLKRFLRQENFAEHLELHRLDCAGSHGDLSNHAFCLQKLAEFGQEKIRPEPLVTGHDLIRLGFIPGPLFSEILNWVEDRQLEEEIVSREQALECVKNRWGSRIGTRE